MLGMVVAECRRPYRGLNTYLAIRRMLSRNAVNATIMLRNEFFTYLLRCYVLL
jgi:hypothetical protein